jgi:hypothetical protein
VYTVRTSPLRYPRFRGNGYIAMTSLTSLASLTTSKSRDRKTTNITIVIVIRPEHQDGLLLYNGDSHVADMIGLWLIQGHVELRSLLQLVCKVT